MLGRDTALSSRKGDVFEPIMLPNREHGATHNLAWSGRTL